MPTSLTAMVSTDLANWNPADILETIVLETGAGYEVVEIHLAPPPGGRLFLRFEAVLNL